MYARGGIKFGRGIGNSSTKTINLRALKVWVALYFEGRGRTEILCGKVFAQNGCDSGFIASEDASSVNLEIWGDPADQFPKIVAIIKEAKFHSL